jgi:hypothetical protein
VAPGGATGALRFLLQFVRLLSAFGGQPLLLASFPGVLVRGSTLSLRLRRDLSDLRSMRLGFLAMAGCPGAQTLALELLLSLAPANAHGKEGEHQNGDHDDDDDCHG